MQTGVLENIKTPLEERRTVWFLRQNLCLTWLLGVQMIGCNRPLNAALNPA
jgi:hypothetical protein